jgi:cold shock CspA family protein
MGGNGGGRRGGKYNNQQQHQNQNQDFGPMHMTKQKGKIRMYNPTKGWGFILAEPYLQEQYGVHHDIFLHSKHFEAVQEVAIPTTFVGHENSNPKGTED